MPKRIRDLTQLVPALGDYLVADKAGGATYKLPLGLANGVPFLNNLGSLAATDAYLDRGYVNSAVDWNNLTEAGVYKIHEDAFGSGAANYPPTTYSFGVLLVFRSYSPAAIVQIYLPHVSDDYIYFREAWDNTNWSPWRALGAKFGSNANGSFIRFADGTQICWASHDPASFGAVASGPDNYRYRLKTWTFPAAFTSAHAVLGSGDTSGAHLCSVAVYNLSSTGCTIEIGQHSSVTTFDVGSAYSLAIGRWK